MNDFQQTQEAELQRIEEWDHEQLLMVVDDDAELFRELLDIYCEDAVIELAALCEAVATSALASVIHHAHTLKGASANVGGERAREACWRMESAARDNDAEGCAALLPIIKKEVEHFIALAQATDFNQFS
jgi:HPt (histidine-containing phosphotransfer) domain-containing protein